MSDILLSAIKEKIKCHGSASLKLSGYSMYPIICEGDEITIEFCKFEQIRNDDIIAFYFNNSEHFIVHRVVDIQYINGQKVFITKGDNNNHLDAKAVKQNNFVGIVKTKNKSTNMYKLAKNIVYLRDRGCVIKYSGMLPRNFPVDILPPYTNNKIKNYNRNLTTELIILFSYRCNLNCIYCSNDSGGNIHGKAIVKVENIKKAISHVIRNVILLRKMKNNTSVKPARIIISGGGEPTIEWDLLVSTVDIVNKFKNEYGNDIVELTILTNAQISDEKAEYLIRNFDFITISCDGLSVQDKQRSRIDNASSKDYVISLLRRLTNSNKEISIRMTVTGDALPYLQDDVEYIFNSFRPIKNIIIEPFVHVGRGTHDGIKKLDYNEFIKTFDVIVRQHYDNIYNSISLLEYKNLYPCQRLSGISLVLSPYNIITCCDTVTPTSTLWDSMVVGSLEDERVEIQNEYLYSIPKHCKMCIAMDFCAGGCPMHTNNLSEPEKEEFCNYMRDMVKTELLRRLEISKKTRTIKNHEIEYSIYSLPRRTL